MKVVTECRFAPEPENELYLALLEPAWRGTAINKALSQYLTQNARIDIADGKGAVSFLRRLDVDKKAEVLRRFGAEGDESEKADAELWDVVLMSQPMDFFVMAAKYLTLYQIKYGKPWQASREITGDKTRKAREERARVRRGRSKGNAEAGAVT
ncbi:MAG: hypothetical protein QG574_4947 [Cyanobacteriota bacterium erpe_2018_sw_21hr_WHONDRS-SW48-000092_B_bin.40]|jgi:hypothetical protein|nr:hypothetical protein [Cyanobacteriota bacterium erpe_2018_sw_21hr_WHONDRS-SW48-000092_B_bin.40]